MKDLGIKLDIPKEFKDEVVNKLLNTPFDESNRVGENLIQAVLLNIDGINKPNVFGDIKFDCKLSNFIQKKFKEYRVNTIWAFYYGPKSETNPHFDEGAYRIVLPIIINDECYFTYKVYDDWRREYMKEDYCYAIGLQEHQFVNPHKTKPRVAIVFDTDIPLINPKDI